MKPPAFQFYPDDFIAGTVTMNHEERGFYILLLCIQWSKGGLTDNDFDRLGRGLVEPSLNHVKAKFNRGSDGVWKNPRLEAERHKQEAYRLLQSEKGKASAEQRLNRGSTVVQPNGVPKVNSPSPSPSPKEKTVAAPLLSSEHQAFIQGWMENFKAQFKFDYSFDGGKDAKAVKELLKLNILRLDLLEIAKCAWKRGVQPPKSFACTQAATIHGFRHNLNQIRTELSDMYRADKKYDPSVQSVDHYLNAIEKL